MRWILGALLVLAACATPEPYPPAGGGGGSPPITPGGADAAIADASFDASGSLAGRACLVADLRQLTTCAASGAGGLDVTLGASTAVTAVDGAFTIARPTTSSPRWRIAGGAITPSAAALGPSGPTAHLIPVVTSVIYDDLELSHGVLSSGAEGAIFISITRQGAPLPGATAVATPTPTYLPFYDGVVAATWPQSQTAAAGVIWLAGVPVGTTSVEVRSAVAAPVTISLEVAAQTLTFATIDVP